LNGRDLAEPARGGPPAVRRWQGRVWLFDLDNTLHDASHAAFAMLDASMNAFIARELQVGLAEADRLRRHYWQRYGATVLGLMRHHGVQAPHFLQDTHRLPGLEAGISGHRHDLAALRRLPGRKVLLTNAPLSYARRVLRVLGVHRLFEELISIEGMRMFGRWRPKPDTRMLRAVAVHLRVPPARCVLVEDTLQHQKAARRVGMRTVWMQRWIRCNKQGPEVDVHLLRKPAYVCARISALQQLQQDVRP
jgi:putative hydrolase of the HAD superfamily